MALTASSSSSIVPNSCKYDVFISFRGPDTRNNFTSHLYAALCRENILAFIDSENLESGEQISTLFRIIEESRLSIVIFSKDYAYSRWCLDELVCIMKCYKEKQHIVFPVFYGIDPSDVRYQKGGYADAFVKHKKRYTEDKMNEWRKALTAASDLSGFDSQKGSVLESKLIEEIVKKILEKLYNTSEIRSAAFTSLVGMKKRFEKIESLLCADCPDVSVIGIYGMGGMGKTTLAKTVYSEFSSKFEGCFFATFREEFNEDDLYHLEKNMISTLLKDKTLDHMTSNFANDRLRRRRVFVVLDNVNQLKQLQCLHGFGVSLQDRFGVGSRIILTSRDRKLLEDAEAVIHDIEAFDFAEALELFCRKAFRGEYPMIDFEELSKEVHYARGYPLALEFLSRKAFGGDSPMTDFARLSTKVVDYAQGNPLALDVLGSHLRSRSVIEWESTLVKLEKEPDKNIDKVLKISYDELDNGTKAIFLDIAFFFGYEKRDLIERILGDESHTEINILIEKSLITITEDYWIQIHNLLRQMAFKIVKGESKQVGGRSRLNNAQDVYDVLKNNKGTAEIEGIFLDLRRIPEDLCLSSTVFKDMCNLRILIIYSTFSNSRNCKSINFPNGSPYLPESLRYLKWFNCPLKSLEKFEPINLVKLEMRYSRLEELWKGVKNLENLEDIDLMTSSRLIQLPDLSKAPKLENIDLSNCMSLHGLPNISASLKYLDLSLSGIEALPSSFGSVENIVRLQLNSCHKLKNLPELPKNIKILSLMICKSLESLPSNIWTLKSLQELDLSGCSSLKTLREISDRTGLRVLCLRNCEELMFQPKCLNTFSDLSSPSLHDCSKLGSFPSRLHGLHLTKLRLGYCNLPEIPDWLGSLSSLTYLDLSANHFETIPSSIKQLDKLQILRIGHCKKLRHLPALPLSILAIEAGGCTSLETVDCSEAFKELPFGPGSLEEYGFSFVFNFCNCCEMDQSSRHNVFAYFIYRVYSHTLSAKYDPAVTTCYPGNEIPDWFNTRWEGSTKAIELPQDLHNYNLLGFAICVALELHGSFTISTNKKSSFATLYFKTKDKERKYYFDRRFLVPVFEITVGSDHVLMWYQYDPDIKLDLMNLDEVEASIKLDYKFEKIINVKRCGLRLIYGQEALEECPNSQVDSTIAQGLICQEIIPWTHDFASNSNSNECYSNGCLISELPEGPTLITDAEESSMQRTKHFDICGCLPFLSIIIEWKGWKIEF